MREIIPGIFHWTSKHPKIHIPVSSYYLRDDGLLLDPLVPAQGLDAFDNGVEHVILTNRHHYRHSGVIKERFGCTVRCVRQGMHEFTHGERVEPFDFGDTLPGNIETMAIGALCPDETALLIPRDGGVLAVADGVVRDGDGPLGFVPDEYMGDDPEGVKAALKRAYAPVLDRPFEHMLLAHGHPWVGGAREALRRFIEG